MDVAAYKHHGNFPRRQSTPLPSVSNSKVHSTQETETPETRPRLALTEDEGRLPENQVITNTKSQRRRKLRQPAQSPVRCPNRSVAALLKRIRIHPEARRVLGVSRVAVVSLERLDPQSGSCLHSVMSRPWLPGQTLTTCCGEASGLQPQQTGIQENEPDVFETEEEAPLPYPAYVIEAESTISSWIPHFDSGSFQPGPPELGSGSDCESNPDQPYILFDSGSDEGNSNEKTGSDTFYLDPDWDGEMVIEDGPELVEMELERDSNYEQVALETENPELDADRSEDFCAVCLSGGDLLCCDRCPKVFHLPCHVPSLSSLPQGDWSCTLCRSYLEPEETYDCKNMPRGGALSTYSLSPRDQRRCEKLTLLLYCHLLSAPFHEAVSAQVRNYYQIIKRPIDLSVIRKRLDQSNTLHYFTAEQFVDDVMLMFRNCATFNDPDSEVAQAGQELEVFFLSKLKDVFPDQIFLSARRDSMDQTRRQWLNRKERRDMMCGKSHH